MTQSPTSAILQFSGIDPGYWGGWYGAIVRNPYLTASYTTQQLVTTGILDSVINAPVEATSVLPTQPVIASEPLSQPVQSIEVVQQPQRVEQPDVEPVAQVEQPAQPEQVEQQEQVAEAVAEVKAEGGKVSAKSVAAQLGSAYNPAAQGVMMALMNRPQIKQPSLTDTQFYVDKGLRDKSIKDRFWLDSLVSDVKWNKMVDSDYDR